MFAVRPAVGWICWATLGRETCSKPGEQGGLRETQFVAIPLLTARRGLSWSLEQRVAQWHNSVPPNRLPSPSFF